VASRAKTGRRTGLGAIRQQGKNRKRMGVARMESQRRSNTLCVAVAWECAGRESAGFENGDLTWVLLKADGTELLPFKA
jgi:hypothetical protein